MIMTSRARLSEEADADESNPRRNFQQHLQLRQ
jgi:hypothetical protein